MYANQINLGQRGSFSIDGFGEAAQAYFGKDVRQLDLAECAMLAGIIQSPNLLQSLPASGSGDRTAQPGAGFDGGDGAITKEQAERAKAEPLHLVPGKRGCQRGALFCRPGARSTDAEAWRARFQPRRVADLHVARSGSAAGGRRSGGCRTVHVVDEQVDKLHATRRRSSARPYHLSAGGAGRAESAHRAGAGAGGRAQLWHTQLNHAVAHAPDRIDLQAVCLCGGFQHGGCRARPCRDRTSLFRR